MKDVLDQKLTLVSVNISIFSGYRRATREHIALLGGLLPDSSAVTEGSIKVFPCEGTKSLQTVRRSIARKLKARGIHALGSQNVFAVLTEDLPEIEKEISQAQADFRAELNALDASYESEFENHIAQNPEAERIIRSLKIDRATAISKCRFSSDVFKIAPYLREGQCENEGIEGIVHGLGRQLYEEFADNMCRLLRNEAFVRQRVGQKTLRPLKAEVAKMERLSFLDPTVEGAIKLVRSILQVLPQEGYIEGQDFITLEKLVEHLSDADTLLNAASKVQNGIAPCDVLFPPMTAKPAEVVVAPVAPVALSPVGDSGRQAMMLPHIPTATLPGVSADQEAGIKFGGEVPTIPLRPAPVLKSPETLKTNALMF